MSPHPTSSDFDQLPECKRLAEENYKTHETLWRKHDENTKEIVDVRIALARELSRLATKEEFNMLAQRQAKTEVRVAIYSGVAVFLATGLVQLAIALMKH
jgi:hypothetical protein